ncbi:MAG: hypothetical protein KDN20_13085 [Verrucomicrobiae bacterium]|nr:hypothetical protein [Verrucomicrobiae bacterium]
MAANGSAGVLLLDPRNGIISTAAHAPAGSPFIINRNTLQTALASNNVVVSTFDSGSADAGNISIEDSVIWNSAFSFTTLAEGDIYVGNDVINRGSGNVNLVAGWNPITAPLGITDGTFYNTPLDVDMDASVFDVAGAFGNNNGSVFVGTVGDALTGADTGVVVASRTGQTNVAGYDVNVWGYPLTGGINVGERKYSQIGYNRRDAGLSATEPATGRIRVKAVNNIDITSNKAAVGTLPYAAWTNADHTGLAAYAKIGHGGEREAVLGSDLSGDIIVEAGNDITAEGGVHRENFVMIGHGGYDNKRVDSTAVIGAAAITVTAGGNITFTGGAGATAFAQIGHGGVTHDLASFTKNEINVTAGGDISLQGAAPAVVYGSTSYAQIGHGGYDSDYDGPVGGSIFSGDVTVEAGGKVSLLGGDTSYNYALIGNGGAALDGDRFGIVSVQAGTGGILLQGGSGTSSFAQIGSGGYQLDGETAGDTIVKAVGLAATDGIVMQGGTGSYAGATIGHGNYFSPATSSAVDDITVEVAAGGLSLTASTDGYFSHAAIGHNSRDTRGDRTGAINVTVASGDIEVTAGGDRIAGSSYNHAQIGHGGYGNILDGEFYNSRGSISVEATAGAVTVSGGQDYGTYAMIGHGGFGAGTGIDGTFSGNISVIAENDITFTGGTSNAYNFAQLGHGGRDVDGSKGGVGETIVVTSNSGDINFTAGSDGAYSHAQIGHGGRDSQGDAEASIFVTAGGNINFDGGPLNSTSYNSASIGHGGTSATGDFKGDITVESNGATGIRFKAGDGSQSWTQIGHGGWNADATVGNSGNISVTAKGGGDIDFSAVSLDSDSNDSFTQIGHGGRDSSGSHFGTISVATLGGGDISFTGGDYRAYAQIGHGGRDALGDQGADSGNPGDATISKITVNSSGAITFTAGQLGQAEAYAQLGHGGYQSRGDHLGDIDVDALGAITFLSGNGDRNSAVLGHGGYDADNVNGALPSVGSTGNIEVNAGAGITFTGGSASYAMAQIGHGGYANYGDNVGDITVGANGDIVFTGGQGDVSYAQLGHGGNATRGSHHADITVNAGTGGIQFTAGGRLSHAQLGNGGNESDGIQTGDIDVTAGGDITFLAGVGTLARERQAYAQLGHGGLQTSGAHSGDISVQSTGGALLFKAGNLSDNYVQLGHGGRGAKSDSTTTGFLGDIDVSAATGITFTAGTMLARTTANGFTDLAPFSTLPTDADITNGDEGIYADGRLSAQLGHGGYDADAGVGNEYNAGVGHRGDIRVVTATGNISFNGGDTANGSAGNNEGRLHMAAIGHGGPASTGDHTGAIQVEATTGSVVFTGGAETVDFSVNNTTGVVSPTTDVYNSVAIGHFGTSTWGSTAAGIGRFSANSVGGTLGLADGISVTAGDAVNFTAGAGRRSQAQLGLGGYQVKGLQDGLVDHQGDIFVTAGAGGVNFIGGSSGGANTGLESYAQLGHGGYDSDGTMLGDITVTTTGGGGVMFEGGLDNATHAQMGHGGRDSNGSQAGKITVNASGSVEVRGGGSGVYSYAQIGHGGYNADGDLSGDVSVTAGAGGVKVIGGDNTYNFATIGNGGAQLEGDISGATTVRATGTAATDGIYVKGGEGGEAAIATIGHSNYYGGTGSLIGDIIVSVINGGVKVEGGTAGYFASAMIGHGGRDIDMDRSGVVSVTADAGDIELLGGGDFTTSRYSHAQIGHGGYNNDAAFAGTYSDGVTVHAKSGQVTLKSGEEYGNYARIGHGGWSNGTMLVDANGDICVVGANGVIVDGSGAGGNAYAAIGHGGRLVDGDFDGDITVVASDGNVELIAGNAGAMSQIGHGGESADGAMSGDIRVIADDGSGTAGDIILTGGNNTLRYAMIGHGHGAGVATTGTREGGVHLFAGGALTATNGIAGGNVNVFHQTNGGLAAVDYLGGDGFQMVANGGVTLPGSALVDVGTMINGNFGSGPINVAFANDIDLTIAAGNDRFLNSAEDFTLATGGSITMLSSYQNAGSGKITLVAGWDGTGGTATGQVTFTGGDFCQPVISGSGVAVDFNTCDAFGNDLGGNGAGSITLGDSAQLAAVRVGSRAGTTGLFGKGVNLVASDSTIGAGTQVGFFSDGSGDVTGGIEIGVKGDGLSMTSGAVDDASTQIGHGGFSSVGALVNAPISISFCDPGALSLLAGGGANAYAQIGNGGRSFAGEGIAGDILIDGSGDVLLQGGNNGGSYAQIGHGGRGAIGDSPASMADGNPDFEGKIELTTVAGGNLTVSGNQTGGSLADGRWAYAQIGHGGAQARGDTQGSIDLSIDGGVNVNGGVLMDAGTSRAQNYAQIGHGGWDGDGAHSGNIDLTAVNDVVVRAGLSRESYAQIGHGGRNENVGDNDGNITIDITAGSLDLVGGNGGGGGEFAYAQVGHGGTSATGNHSGDITVTSADEVTLLQGVRDGAYKLIGHGGHGASGNHSGQVQVTAVNDIRLVGGTNDITFAQIGHGGFGANGNMSATSIEVTTSAGAIEVTAGNAGSSNQDGRQAYAQIGLGGYAGDGSRTAPIQLNAATGISVTGGGRDHNYALIGHGGDLADGTKSGAISAITTAGNISLSGGIIHELTAAQIGHGGFRATGAADGAITVSTGGGAVTLRNGGGDDANSLQTAGDHSFSSAQIGHGGAETGNFSRDGAISVSATTGVSVDSSTRLGDRAYTQIGHGGYDSAGNMTGQIDVDAGAGAISVLGGSLGAEGQFAQIGHGGINSLGNGTGAINLTAGGNVDVIAGGGDASYALVGHGGLFSTGYYDGDIGVDAGGAVNVLAGGTAGDSSIGTNNFGQIGHSLQGATAGYGNNFVEVNGQIVIEAESYLTNPSNRWVVVPTGADPFPGPGLFNNPRGGVYLQLEEGAGGVGPLTTGREVTYQITVTNPGTYQFFPRWTGYDGGSDSIFFDVVELKDGNGGAIADWYEYAEGGNSNFDNPAWSLTGAAEANNAGATPRTATTWTFNSPGTYTVRAIAREDGLALDALVMQQVALAAPTGQGPAPTYELRAGATGNVTVNAVGDISVTGGINDGAHAAIGHGGSDINNLAGRVSYGSATTGANVTVRSSGGNITLAGGQVEGDSALATGRYASIGHHGSRADFDAFGDILVEGGNIGLDGGFFASNGAKIGHGGDGISAYNLNDAEGPATLSGKVEVHSSGSVDLVSGGALAGSTLGSSAQIGHGGAVESVELVEIDGEICVVSADGTTVNAATNGGEAAYAMVGHGGINLQGTKSGDVTLTTGSTGTGGVALTAGAGDSAFAQVGHGGLLSGGDMSGNLNVIAANGGAIAVNGGSGSGSYAMLGHGDGASSTTGTRQGGVHLFADGALTAANGGGAGSNAYVFHQTNGGLATVDYLGGDGFQMVSNGGVTVDDSALVDVNTMLNGNFATGPIWAAFSNEIDLSIAAGLDRNVNTADNFVLMTGGSLEMLSSYQNAGTGETTLVAGWDGSGSFAGGGVTFAGGDFCAPVVTGAVASIDFNTCTSFGNNGAGLTLGSAAQTSAVRVGSRDGLTTLAGNSLALFGSDTTSNAATHLGFYGDGGGAITGGIDLHLQGGGLNLDSGNASGAYTQIGHGGRSASSTAVSAPITITFCDPGDVVIEAGGSLAYAQIGHGGHDFDADVAGDITMTGSGSVDIMGGPSSNSYSKVGHGGNLVNGNQLGNIAITTADGSITIQAGADSATDSNATAQVGHGGRSGSGSANGNISVIANGVDADVAVLGGTGNEALAMIGHGGTQDTGNKGLDGQLIEVSATRDVRVVAGTTNNTLAQIGNGGLASSGTKLGDISVTAGRDVLVTGGQAGGDDAYAQIGHGGAQTSNTIRGNITVNAGGLVELRAGTNPTPTNTGADTPNYSQIGHGGHENTGTLGALGNKIEVTGDIVQLISGSGVQSYAQIGMGGYDAGGNLTGDICVHATTAVILDSNQSAGTDAYTMIGNGGTLSGSGSSLYRGDIVVTAGSGGVNLRGGDGASTGRFTQVGHGGINTNGAMSGEIFIGADAGGRVVMTGGAGTNAYAMGGHGDGVGTAGVLDSGTSGGTRQGGIQYFADGDLTLTNGGGVGSNTYLHHRTNNAGGLEGAGNYLGGNGYQVVANRSQTIPANALEGLSAMINGSIGSGNVVFTNPGDVDIVLSGPDVATNNSFNFIVMTGGDITMLHSYQNAGAGNLILIAGWDGSSSTGASLDLGVPCDPVIIPAIVPSVLDFNDCGVFGNNNGTVYLGDASQTTALRVGSRLGRTMVYGYGLELNASTATSSAATQLGFFGNGSGDISGEIDVRLKDGGLSLNAGTSDAYAQIGHGGKGAVSANITDTADITISFCDPGDVTLNAGTGGNAYAQIGHGGLSVGGTKAGDIRIVGRDLVNGAGNVRLNGGSQSQNYAQIGHGGIGGSGATQGDIRVVSSNQVVLTGGTDQDAYTQIGHGGHDNRANHGVLDDATVVIANQGISLTGGNTAGTTYGAYAQIGNGGYDADGTLSGSIYLNYDPDSDTAAGGGDVVLLATTKTTAEPNYGTTAQIGHGGRNLAGTKSGDIVIGTADNVSVTGGQNLSYAQIGHGGNDSGATGNDGNTSGSITIDALGLLTVQGGVGSDAYAQIGHGGYQNSADHGVAGDVISLSAINGLSLLGGGTRSYAQVGNGGRTAGGNHSADISFNGGPVTLLGGTGGESYTQIGHGGHTSSGNHTGSVTVDSSSGISMTGGSSTGYTQIGHGGQSSSGNQTGSVTVNSSADISMTGGGSTGNYTHIGHGGRSSGGTFVSDIAVTAVGSVYLNGGRSTDTYAQIGHGGLTGSFTTSGLINLGAGGDLVLTADSNNGYVQVGHGGSGATGSISGADITIDVVGGIDLNADTGNSGNSYAQIGHGGFNTMTLGASDSDIFINQAAGTGTGDITLNGSGTNSYAQIGHGGSRADGNAGTGPADRSGDITIARVANVALNGGTFTDGYAQIGHGGELADGNASGDIVLNATGDVALNGGSASDTYVQIGHGGDQSAGDTNGSISITSLGSVSLQGGSVATDAYAQIGNGGHLNPGNHGLAGEVIAVSGANGISLAGGTSGQSYAQIGNGGGSASGEDHAHIFLNVNPLTGLPNGGGAITLAGGSATGTYSQVGNGGDAGAGAASGNVVTFSTGATTLNAGSGTDAWTQIGHGGRSNDGDKGLADEAIVVVSLGGIDMNSAGTRGYTQIGHGGHESDGNLMGGIYLNYDPINNVALGGGNVTLDGGTGSESYSQIGHGGLNSDVGTKTGDIRLGAAADVSLDAGSGNLSYVQIGHGGYNGDGNATGDIRLDLSGSMNVSAGNTTSNTHAQIGHGGRDSGGIHTGSIEITSSGAAGALTLVGGGNGDFNYSQIGHGGAGVIGGVTNGDSDDFISASFGGDISLVAGTQNNGYAQLGNGGLANSGTHRADISVTSANGTISLTGGPESGSNDDDSYAQIGNGGAQQTSTTRGSITVLASNGDVILQGGGGENGINNNLTPNYAQIGNGGHGNSGDHGDASETIQVEAANVSLTAGTQEESFALIGNGGGIVNEAGSGNASGDLAGNVIVRATQGAGGSVTLKGSTSGGLAGFAQIGHARSLGSLVGDIEVSAVQGVLVEGGTSAESYAQIGHGGIGQIGSKTGVIQVTLGGDLAVAGGVGDQAYGTIGHGGINTVGDRAGLINATVGGSVALTGGAGAGSSAQIGHGGTGNQGAEDGDVIVEADSIALMGGGDGSFAQIGHGGLMSGGAISSNVVVSAAGGDVQLSAGAATDSFAIIGGGGSRNVGVTPINGDVTVTADGGAVTLDGGGDGAFALIGNGGYEVNGTKTGSVQVAALQDVALTAGIGAGSFSQIGLGGFNSPGNTLGASDDLVRVIAGGDLRLRASDTAVGSMAMVGSGGYFSSSVFNTAGDVVADAGGDIVLTGGAAAWAAAQIGNGGGLAGGAKSGDIFATAGNDVLITRGAGDNAYAKIGHGDQEFTPVAVPAQLVGGAGTVAGDVQVTAGRDVSLTGGLIGHLDPDLNNQALSITGDTYVAVSHLNPTAAGGGMGALIGDADSVLASSPGGELRLYLPGRPQNQLVGTSLNGLAYPGANVDPMNQQIDELVINQVNGGGTLLAMPSEHDNLSNAAANRASLTVTSDSANYSPVLGNYSLYYDTVVVNQAGPPVVPTTPGGGAAGAAGGAAGAAGSAGAIDGGAAGSAGTGEGSVPLFTVVGPNGNNIVIFGTPGEELGLFLTLPDGTVGFTPGRLSPNSPFVPVGFVLEGLLDDRFNDDQTEFVVEHREVRDPWGDSTKEDFSVSYDTEGSSGSSSFDVFGSDYQGTIYILPMGDSPTLDDDEFRRYLEELQMRLEEMGSTALSEPVEPGVQGAE